MTQDSKTDAARALHRFGLGPRPGSIAAIASDPRGALIAELERPSAGRINQQDLRSSGEAARTAAAFQQARQEMQRQARKTAPAGDQQGADPNKPAGTEKTTGDPR